MKAVPVNNLGETIGSAKIFSEEKWRRMKSALKNSRYFPWKIVDDNYQPSVGRQLMKVSTIEAKSVKVEAPAENQEPKAESAPVETAKQRRKREKQEQQNK